MTQLTEYITHLHLLFQIFFDKLQCLFTICFYFVTTIFWIHATFYLYFIQGEHDAESDQLTYMDCHCATKGQLISEWPFDVLNCPKNNAKIWWISALESKKWLNQKDKGTLSYVK